MNEAKPKFHFPLPVRSTPEEIGVWVATLAKAGSNPDQRPTAAIRGPGRPSIKVGEVFHVKGQPGDVLWRITDIRPADK